MNALSTRSYGVSYRPLFSQPLERAATSAKSIAQSPLTSPRRSKPPSLGQPRGYSAIASKNTLPEPSYVVVPLLSPNPSVMELTLLRSTPASLNSLNRISHLSQELACGACA